MDDYYGIAMFFFKEAYNRIPDEIKIVYGDSWIFTHCQRMKRQNYRICGCTIYHYGSLSSYEEIWDCHKYRLLGMTLKIKKKKPWGKRYA